MANFLNVAALAVCWSALSLAHAGPAWDWNAVNSKLTCTQPTKLPNGALNDDACGFVLQNGGGWDELTRCSDGYRWSYVLKEANKPNAPLKFCYGASTKSGFKEAPCTTYVGDLKDFAVGTTNCLASLKSNSAVNQALKAEGPRLPLIVELSDRQKKCQSVRCVGSGCGCKLIKQGWRETASCDGHQWSYLIEKNALRKQCSGIASLGGFSETECVAFAGVTSAYKKGCRKSDQ